MGDGDSVRWIVYDRWRMVGVIEDGERCMIYDLCCMACLHVFLESLESTVKLAITANIVALENSPPADS